MARCGVISYNRVRMKLLSNFLGVSPPIYRGTQALRDGELEGRGWGPSGHGVTLELRRHPLGVSDAWFVTALCSLQCWEALPLQPKDLALTIIVIS